MQAVIKTGGKQYLVTEGQKLIVEKLPGEAGNSISFDGIMLIVDGDTVKVGQPTLKGASVDATIVRQGRAKKIIVQKYKPKVRYRKKRGHRQPFTELAVSAINA